MWINQRIFRVWPPVQETIWLFGLCLLNLGFLSDQSTLCPQHNNESTMELPSEVVKESESLVLVLPILIYVIFFQSTKYMIRNRGGWKCSKGELQKWMSRDDEGWDKS